MIIHSILFCSVSVISKLISAVLPHTVDEYDDDVDDMMLILLFLHILCYLS